MYANYHTHTVLCNHATGEMRDYVESAIRNGIKVLGFSDHVPYPFKNGHYSYFRMRVCETQDYVNRVLALREEFKDKIKIYIGYEAEYYPADFEAMLENICKFECDYLILGQHFTHSEFDGTFSSRPTDDKAVFTQYVSQVIKAMKTQKFSYVAHPDLINYRADMDLYREQMTKLCKASKRYSVPLELNLLGLEDHRAYPYKPFWRIAAETRCDVVLGSDAHYPEALGSKKAETMAKKFLEEFGITPLETIEFKNVK